MKKQILILCAAILFVAASGSVIFGQDKKMDKMMMPDKMMMAEMMKSPHHAMMTAYKQNVVNFAAALRDMAGEKNVRPRSGANRARRNQKRRGDDGRHSSKTRSGDERGNASKNGDDDGKNVQRPNGIEGTYRCARNSFEQNRQSFERKLIYPESYH